MEIGRLQICRNNGGSAEKTVKNKIGEKTQRMVGRNKYCTGTEGCQKDKKGVRNYGACVRSEG